VKATADKLEEAPSDLIQSFPSHNKKLTLAMPVSVLVKLQ
jgi:hypothetical protein